MIAQDTPNRLYYGDCLTIMLEWPSHCVDLIYLDPPFNSNRQYNAIYKDETGRPLPDQVEAFCDMWELDAERERAIRAMPVLMREAGIDDPVVEFWRLWMSALRGTQPRLLAYLSYMAQRLLIMHRILKPTGSLYLHCDPTASHYVKALMDAIFGHQNFQNEIIWQRTSAHNDAHRYGAIHDTILFYSRSESWEWNPQYQPYGDDYKARFRRKDPDGRLWTDGDLTAKGLTGGGYEYPYKGKTDLWRVPLSTMERLDSEGRLHFTNRGGIRIKRYLDELPGRPAQSIWSDIPPINSQAAERMGYATQKPLALMERIIAASSNPGDVVLDPFCGCASTIEAAHNLGRRWVGIDIAIHAIKRVASVRLGQRLGLVEGQDYIVEGVPRTVEGAQDLWERDPYHFQKWAVEQSDGFVTNRRSADGGVDGRLYFAVPHAEELQSMVIEVKGGKSVNISVLRALRGVLDYDDALMAGLIVLHPPAERQARNFAQFMAEAGELDILGIQYPRMQILTVAEILDGKRFMTPTVAGRHTPQPRFPGIPR
ncbi:MAG: site-specific DNA-methyltransferase [Chloroflexi bacterium]|nr:site-specific DNA-methyltransferase [Chloroflexota bacterium]